jgi:hypothetical protein
VRPTVSLWGDGHLSRRANQSCSGRRERRRGRGDSNEQHDHDDDIIIAGELGLALEIGFLAEAFSARSQAGRPHKK